MAKSALCTIETRVIADCRCSAPLTDFGRRGLGFTVGLWVYDADTAAYQIHAVTKLPGLYFFLKKGNIALSWTDRIKGLK